MKINNNKKDTKKNEEEIKNGKTSNNVNKSHDKLTQDRLTKERNYKIIIFIIIFIIVIIMATSILIKYFRKSNYDNNINYNDETYIRNNITEYDIGFKCSMINENSEEIESYDYTEGNNNGVYGSGDNLLCNLISSNYKKKYKKVTFKLSGKYIKLEKAYSNDSSISVNTLNQDNNSVLITLESEQYIKELKGVKLRLSVDDNLKNNEKNNIDISDITIFTSSYTYDYLQQLSLELKHNPVRVVRNNGVLKFQVVSSDGTYETTSEYTCTDKSCNVNTAMQAFYYQNSEDKNIVLISDYQGEDDLRVFYDVNNGVIATYGGIPRWLYTKDGEEKYIYISDRSNNNHGIVDKRGNIVHDFNLNIECREYQGSNLCINYSIEDNLFVNKSDNKYGIVRLNSNDIVIDYKYDDIKLLDSKHFKAKENEKWYVYNINTKNKQINQAYNDIYFLSDNILLVLYDDYWRFINFDNKEVISDKIKYDSEYKYVENIIEDKDSNIIKISFCNDFCHDTERAQVYRYFISSKKLEKVK